MAEASGAALQRCSVFEEKRNKQLWFGSVWFGHLDRLTMESVLPMWFHESPRLWTRFPQLFTPLVNLHSTLQSLELS